MTKYILNSGGIRNEPALKKMFHREIVAGLGESPVILMCNFAQGREFWEVKFDEYTNSVIEDVECHPSFVLAFPEVFEQQVSRADVVYFHGGDDHLVQYWIKQFNCAELFKDKVIATNSASSNMIVQSYWTCDWRQCGEGLGLVPIKFIPHFKSSFGENDMRGPVQWDYALEELRAYGDAAAPVYALKEGEYAVFEDTKHVKTITQEDA